MNIIQKLKALLGQGHERTVRAKKNILLAIVFRALGVLIGFAYFPISLDYLGPVKFGIFLTLTSIIDWFAEFDIGIGNGLRNRLGEAVADGDHEQAKGYVSTAYFAIGSIFSAISVLFIVVSYWLPWTKWMQTEAALHQEIAILAMLMFGAFAVSFISSLVYQIFYSLQRTAIVDFYTFLTKLAFLIIIIVLPYFTKESLILFGVAKTFTFALFPLFIGLYYFRNEFKRFRPSYRWVGKSFFKGLFSLGIQFFVIKIAMLIIHQTNNVLIAGFVSLEGVPKYEAAFKYLSIFLMLFVILTNQLWGASVEAYRKGEMDWMKKTIRSVFLIWLGTLFVSVIMILASPFVYQIWLQGKIEIPFLLTITVAVSVAMTNWINMFNLILNGTGKVRMQMYAWIAASILNIPLSIFFAKTLNLGTVGIVLGTIVCMLPLAILSPWQVLKILSKRDKGIWAQ